MGLASLHRYLTQWINHAMIFLWIRVSLWNATSLFLKKKNAPSMPSEQIDLREMNTTEKCWGWKGELSVHFKAYTNSARPALRTGTEFPLLWVGWQDVGKGSLTWKWYGVCEGVLPLKAGLAETLACLLWQQWAPVSWSQVKPHPQYLERGRRDARETPCLGDHHYSGWVHPNRMDKAHKEPPSL